MKIVSPPPLSLPLSHTHTHTQFVPLDIIIKFQQPALIVIFAVNGTYFNK